MNEMKKPGRGRKGKQKMLQKITLICTHAHQENASYNWGLFLHGALMELLPDKISNTLHEINLRPFSQYLVQKEGRKLEWNIGLWDNEIANHITNALMSVSEININHKGIKLEVVGAEHRKQSKNDFLFQFFNAEVPHRRYEMEFLTPCTHRSGGEFVMFPTPELIIKGLCMRFSAFSQDYSIDDPETMDQVAENVRMTRYSLRSANFYVEGGRVTGYLGRISLLVGGPDQLARLAGMLLSFSEYSGVGVKTALGMGGCRIRKIKHTTKNMK